MIIFHNAQSVIVHVQETFGSAIARPKASAPATARPEGPGGKCPTAGCVGWLEPSVNTELDRHEMSCSWCHYAEPIKEAVNVSSR